MSEVGALTWTPDPETDEDLLSVRERQIVALLLLGLTNKEIGARVFVSAATVKTHLAVVSRKLGVHNRREVAAWGRTNLRTCPNCGAVL